MPLALLVLAGCQLLGEVVRAACHLPVPGPVIGMFILAAVLGLRMARSGQYSTPAPLKPAAETLIANMGLLFVPAGVGIIAQFDLIRAQWLPISAALAGSTVLSLGVTGLVMHTLMRMNLRRQAARAGQAQPRPPVERPDPPARNPDPAP